MNTQNETRVRGMLHIPAADRNKDPILEILKKSIPSEAREGEELNLIEIASGTGQHVVHFAEHLPHVLFQPTECDQRYLRSIRAYISHSGLQNICDPLHVDVRTPYSSWGLCPLPKHKFSFMLSINMIHITQIACTEGLFKNSQEALKSGGILFLYGPFAFGGVITPESNVMFNQQLKQDNPAYGLRDVDYLKDLASKYGSQLIGIHSLPANNHVLEFKKN